MAFDKTSSVLKQEVLNEGEISVAGMQNVEALINEADRESRHADELINIAHDMQRIHGVIKEAPADSISPAAANALGVAVEAFCQIAGIPKQRVFAMEGYRGGYASRQLARKLALESISDIIKKVVTKLLQWIKKIYNYLYDTMQELIAGADNLLRASQEIMERARAIAHKSIKDGADTIDDRALTSFFSQDGKVYKADDVVDAYTRYCADMKTAFSAGFVKEVGLRVGETMEQAASGESKEATENKITEILLGMRSKTFHKFKKVGQRTEVSELAEWVLPFGQQRLTVMMTKNTDSEGYTGFAMDIAATTGGSSAMTEKVLETMNYTQIVALAKAVEKEMLFGLFKSYKDSKADLGKIRNVIEKGCDKISRDQQSSNRSTTVTFSVGFLKDLASALVKALSVTHQYDITVARHLLTYCNQSIKKHS